MGKNFSIVHVQYTMKDCPLAWVAMKFVHLNLSVHNS